MNSSESKGKGKGIVPPLPKGLLAKKPSVTMLQEKTDVPLGEGVRPEHEESLVQASVNREAAYISKINAIMVNKTPEHKRDVLRMVKEDLKRKKRSMQDWVAEKNLNRVIAAVAGLLHELSARWCRVLQWSNQANVSEFLLGVKALLAGDKKNGVWWKGDIDIYVNGKRERSRVSSLQQSLQSYHEVKLHWEKFWDLKDKNKKTWDSTVNDLLSPEIVLGQDNKFGKAVAVAPENPRAIWPEYNVHEVSNNQCVSNINALDRKCPSAGLLIDALKNALHAYLEREEGKMSDIIQAAVRKLEQAASRKLEPKGKEAWKAKFDRAASKKEAGVLISDALKSKFSGGVDPLVLSINALNSEKVRVKGRLPTFFTILIGLERFISCCFKQCQVGRTEVELCEAFKRGLDVLSRARRPIETRRCWKHFPVYLGNGMEVYGKFLALLSLLLKEAYRLNSSPNPMKARSERENSISKLPDYSVASVSLMSSILHPNGVAHLMRILASGYASAAKLTDALHAMLTQESAALGEKLFRAAFQDTAGIDSLYISLTFAQNFMEMMANTNSPLKCTSPQNGTCMDEEWICNNAMSYRKNLLHSSPTQSQPVWRSDPEPSDPQEGRHKRARVEDTKIATVREAPAAEKRRQTTSEDNKDHSRTANTGASETSKRYATLVYEDEQAQLAQEEAYMMRKDNEAQNMIPKSSHHRGSERPRNMVRRSIQKKPRSPR